MNSSSAKRKYMTEAVLNIYSSGTNLMSPSDLDKVSQLEAEQQEILRQCNIYLITKRKRISVVPESLVIKGRVLSGELVVHTNDGPLRVPFCGPAEIPEEITRVVSEYPYTKIRMLDHNDQLLTGYPVLFLMPTMRSEIGRHADLEVVYIGQAYGNAGNRSAIDRLMAHSTLQKILADIAANEPNSEVWLALYKFEFHRFILSMDGMGKPEVTGDEDKLHYQEILEARFKRSMRISMAEAALIRYFKPQYNKVYKVNFPHNNQKILQKAYKLDLAGLTVEINCEELKLALFSEHTERLDHHICNFNLHSIDERKSFFFEPAI